MNQDTQMRNSTIIAIVDDDDSVRTALESLLRSSGYKTRTYCSAQEFLNANAPAETHCLISDIQMPGMSGVELHEQLVAMGFHIPTIFVTAYPGMAPQLDKHNRNDVGITLLAPQAELRIRPRFYETDVHKMFAPLDGLFDSVGVRFIKGTAERIDEQTRTVGYRDEAGRQGALGYDRLVLAAGSQLARPTVPGLDSHAFDVDQIEAAVRLENHLKSLKNRPQSVARNTVVVAGGGFTGIETATEMPARLRSVLGGDQDIRVIIIDRGSQIAAAMGDGIRPSIVEACEHLGIEWVLDASVATVDANGVTLADGRRIESHTVIWTVGFRASPLTEQMTSVRDAQGRLHVDENLKVFGQDHVYAAGDVAYAATDDLGNFAAMSCQHAISLGRHAGNNVAADLLGVAPTPYRQPKYVTCLDLGAWGAVFTEGWDRQLKLVKEQAKELKTQINTLWIYPPAADRATALAAADPMIPVA